ncbi:hypothetical protein [Tersicoccus sp. Bi-70]|uniref:hypothetical protein n=1 Tax=Tersicoccus sp. Bi-70 TaxID=1897634 RepID=UPI000977C4B3|nr:hypothetical protein [Tersicoccus sp. Bi-70]OMH30638.1 hypothetical protein BGP79_11815 [Tersicoccus sp. Bi-70]
MVEEKKPVPGERLYTVVVDGRVRRLPYTLAKKALLVPRGACRSGLHRGEPPEAERGTWWCTTCTDRVRGWFREIADAWPQLQELVFTGTGEKREGGRATVTGSPAPLDVSVVDVLVDVEQWMRDQAAHLLEDRPKAQLPDDRSGGSLAQWFAWWHVLYVATHPEASLAEALPTEVQERAAQVRRVTEATGRRREWVGRPCAEIVSTVDELGDGARVHCRLPLYFVHPGCEADDVQLELRCDAGHRTPLPTTTTRKPA